MPVTLGIVAMHLLPRAGYTLSRAIFSDTSALSTLLTLFPTGEPISDLLLVADKSSASYSDVEQTAVFLDGLHGIKVTLFFARLRTVRDEPKTATGENDVGTIPTREPLSWHTKRNR